MANGALSNIAQGSAVLLTTLLNVTMNVKHKFLQATISAYLGVTEPALFGVNVQYVLSISSRYVCVCLVQACFQRFLEFKRLYWYQWSSSNLSQLNLNIGQSLRLSQLSDIVVAMVLGIPVPQNWIFNENRDGHAQEALKEASEGLSTTNGSC